VAVVLNPGQGAEALKKLTAALPRNGTLTVRVHGAPSDKVIQQLPPLTGWQTFKAFEMALGKVLDGADILYCADAGNDVAVAEAMARGMPIVAAPSLRRYFGDAAVYSSAAETASAIAKLRKSPRHFAQYAARSRDRATRCHGQADYVRGLCERMKTAAPRAIAPSNPRRRLMMFAQNGVGLGHVVRQLAIARELSADHDIVFCSMSQAYDLISRYGYQVEYLPSHVYTGVEYTEWHGWARAQIEQMIDFHDVGVVVLDGSVPYAGLIEAVAPRPDVRLAWLRRPMWRPGKESSVRIAQQKFFDLVIEPEELAAALDTGPTVAQRERALCVAPIRLLERRELLSREKAAAALGLDPARPAMLIQLGSGTNRDVVSLIDRIVVAARPYSGLQLVLAEWRNANDRLDLWPNVICLRGFPYSRYFNAFDFSFSAAGYNSFHEIFAYRLPTAFLVNPRDYMDGQNLRAEFAAAQGAAIACDGGLAQIASALSRLMSADVRATMRTAMASLARPNGAKTAARAIANLLESMP
jgi:UDP:flavonoid glycosyltransferase YjiC (YdhE family)